MQAYTASKPVTLCAEFVGDVALCLAGRPGLIIFRPRSNKCQRVERCALRLVSEREGSHALSRSGLRTQLGHTCFGRLPA